MKLASLTACFKSLLPKKKLNCRYYMNLRTMTWLSGQSDKLENKLNFNLFGFLIWYIESLWACNCPCSRGSPPWSFCRIMSTAFPLCTIPCSCTVRRPGASSHRARSDKMTCFPPPFRHLFRVSELPKSSTWLFPPILAGECLKTGTCYEF